MKILHCGDYHLRHIHKYSLPIQDKIWDRLFVEKVKVLQQIPPLAVEHKIDWVAITGDVFDTTNPPEAIKRIFVKWLRDFVALDIPVTIIPGNHETTAYNHHAMMDIGEAFSDDDKIFIGNRHRCLQTGVAMFHLMLEGISDKFKNTIKYNDERFKDYKTILLGDYHFHYEKQYADKWFIYSGTPYPTRFGEKNHSFNLVDVKEDGTLVSCEQIRLKSYKMIEIVDPLLGVPLPEINGPVIVKCTIKCKSENLERIGRELEQEKQRWMENPNVIDFVYTRTIKDVSKKEVDTTQSIQQVSENYIGKNIPGEYKRGALELFKTTMSEVV